MSAVGFLLFVQGHSLGAFCAVLIGVAIAWAMADLDGGL